MNLTESVYYVAFMLTTLAAMILVCVQTVFDLGTVMSIVIYSLIALSLVLILLACRNKSELPPAFDFKTKHKLNLYSFLVSGAFVAETVCELLEIYKLHVGKVVVFGGTVLIAVTAVFALLSAFAFALVGISYGQTNHDFRRIPYVVFAPIMWALLRIAQSLTVYSGRDLLSVLKVIALVFLMGFFYRFAFESVKGGETAESTLFVSGAVFTVGSLFWAAHVAALRTKLDGVNFLDLGLVLISLTVAYFAIKFRRGIIDRC